MNPKTHERSVGQVARRQAVVNPENTIFSVKRLMGRKFDEVSEEMKIVLAKTAYSPLLKVAGLNAFYGESHVLHGVDLEVRTGELVTLDRKSTRLNSSHRT